MSKGKYYSLEEARKEKDLEGFAEAHPSEGNGEQFETILGRMAENKPSKTSKKEVAKD